MLHISHFPDYTIINIAVYAKETILYYSNMIKLRNFVLLVLMLKKRFLHSITQIPLVFHMSKCTGLSFRKLFLNMLELSFTSYQIKAFTLSLILELPLKMGALTHFMKFIFLETVSSVQVCIEKCKMKKVPWPFKLFFMLHVKYQQSI